MPNSASSAPIRILHLSDFHFSEEREPIAQLVLDKLIEYIRREVQEGLVPDMVAITGDLAFSGRKEEYTLAREWLDRLWTCFPDTLDKDRLLLVPGNHDVDRKAVMEEARELRKPFLESGDQDLISKTLERSGSRELLFRQHHNYIEFYNAWSGVKRELPWWECTLPIREQKLHVVGLDSAWMSFDDDDYGNLLLSQYQLNPLLSSGEDSSDPDLRIALMHHPWAYVTEREQSYCRSLIHQHCHLVLRGHGHVRATERISGTDGACLELAAGCVYQSSEFGNAFQWIELWPDEQRGKVHFRVWHEGRWMKDRNVSGCPEAVAELELGRDWTDARPNASSDFRPYLRAVWEETSRIDIRALSITDTGGLNGVPIEDIYIQLSAASRDQPCLTREGKTAVPSTAAEPGIAGRQRHPQKLYRALSNHRLVVIGDPGCGKSTFLQWVAHALAAERLGKVDTRTRMEMPRARVPLKLSIAAWLGYRDELVGRGEGPRVGDSAQWLPEYLGDLATGANQGLNADDFLRLLVDGDALILFDGLDEVSGAARRGQAVTLIEAVERAYSGCPLVVTSRPDVYHDDVVLTDVAGIEFPQARIEALERGDIEDFLERWSRAVFPRQEGYRAALLVALEGRREIRRMAKNTVMLTALAVVQWNNRRLPEQRAELYESIIKWLIEGRDSRLAKPLADHHRQWLAELALRMQCGDEGGRRVVELPHWRAAEWLAPRFDGGPVPAGENSKQVAIAKADAFLVDEEEAGGIIVRRGAMLRFWHLTFQDYLAAQAIADKGDDVRCQFLLGEELRIYQPEWRETVLLLGGILHHQGVERVDGLVSAVLDRLYGAPHDLRDQARCAGLLGALSRDLAPYCYTPSDERYREVLAVVSRIFEPGKANAISLPDRIAAADALAGAGDTRLGWQGHERWAPWQEGCFVMGAQSSDASAPGYDEEAYPNEGPVREVEVESFRIARFPITVAEYAEFMEDRGYEDPRWWWAGTPDDDDKQPGHWEDQRAHPSRPVTEVSWYEASAYCAWLSHHLALHEGADGEALDSVEQWIRLPTEEEWEYAARGREGRKYPWGDAPPSRDLANFWESRVGEPSPVGLFPDGATPEGVLDMVGNVWEWSAVEAAVTRPPLRGNVPEEGMPAGPGPGTQVVRGAAFDQQWPRDLRAALRDRVDPETRGWGIGFRCVMVA